MKIAGAIAAAAAIVTALVCVPMAATPAPITFSDATTAAGINFVHNSGRAGQKFLPETMGSGGAFVDLNGDGLARHRPGEQPRLEAAARQAIAVGPVPQQRQRHVHERDGRQRPRRRDVRDGHRRRRLRQRRPRRSLHHVARRRSPVPQRGQLQVPGRHEDGRHRQRELRHERGVVRLRPRRQARCLRRQLRAVAGRQGHLLLARRHHQVVLHARVVQGHRIEALSQPREREVRGRERQGRRRRAHEQVARRRRDRLRRRRLAGSLRRQRHAAQQALSQQPRRHLHREGRGGRRGVLRRRRGPRRDGRGCRRLRRLWARAPAGRQLREPDAGALSQRGQRPVRGRGADVDGGPRQPAVARLRRLLLRLRPRRAPRHLRGQRPHRGRDRTGAAKGAVPADRR